MNHPSPEEWMSFIYGEAPRQERASFNSHLRDCPECRGNVAAWQTTKNGLSHWQLENESKLGKKASAAPALKWALAALVVLGLGYLLGRAPNGTVHGGALSPAVTRAARQQLEIELRSDLLAALTGSSESLNTDFRRQLRSELDLWRAQSIAAARSEAREMVLGFANTYAVNRQEDQQTTLRLLDRLDKQERAEHLSLRRAVETVAVVADGKFQETDSRLGRLASYTEAQLIPGRVNQP